MAQILNRALLIAGEAKKVGTYVVNIRTLNKSNKVTSCSGTNVPADGDAGFAVGCMFYTATGAIGATGYINEGSETSADFNVLNGGGSGGFTTWDQMYANDKTLAVTNTTLTFDGQHASNDVFTLSNSGAGSGSVLQITNVGSGSDIKGTSASWSVSKTGVAVFLSATFSGSGGSNAFTITAGDVLLSDASITMVDADNAATLDITNNTATTATVYKFAGSGVFTGNTTSSFMTLTPSGLTTGTAFYLPVAALTTGKAVHVVANAYTDGLVVNITSSSTAATSTGRLLNVSSTAATGTSTIIAEISSAATDETVIFKVTGSGALALGAGMQVSLASMTTGTAIDVPDLAVLTSGIGLSIVSSATAITGAGRLLFINHTGATTSTGTIAEIKTAATDAANATTLLKLTMAASIVGIGLNIVSTTAMTTGSLIRATTATAGAIATNGVYSFLGTGNFTNGSATLGMFNVTAASTLAGTIMNITGGSLTTGVALSIDDAGTGITSGSLLRIATATTGAMATNGVVSIRATGAYTSTSNAGILDVQSSGLVGAGTLVNIKLTNVSQTAANAVNIEQTTTTTGYTGTFVRVVGSSTTGASKLIGVTAVNTIAGDALNITNNALTLGAGTLVNLVHGTSVIGAGSSMLRITSTGIDTGTSTGTLLDLAATAATTAVLALVTSASLTSGTALRFDLNGLTTGLGIIVSHTTSVIADGGSLLRLSSTGIDTGGATNGTLLDLSSTGQQTGTVVKGIFSALTTGTAMSLTLAALTTSGVGLNITAAGTGLTSGSLLFVSSGSTGAIATNGAVSFQATGAFTSTSNQGFVGVLANSTTAGTVMSISATAATTGTLLFLKATAATLSTGRYLSANDATTEVFGIGLNGHLISTQTTAPTIAVTQQNGITGAAVTAGGTDTCGVITTTGTNNNGGTTIITLTFNKTYTTAPKYVSLMPLNASAVVSSALAYVSSVTATTFVITIPASASSGATPSWAYAVIA
jgi:hypothetical protein